MMCARTGLALHLHSGIPVVDLEGEWDDTTDGLLAETVKNLTSAGHYEIIVNVTRASRLQLLERGWLDGLERLAASIRAHCGHLDVVGTVEQIEARFRRQAQSLARWATSEEQAICRITGVPVTTSGRKVTARLAVSKV